MIHLTHEQIAKRAYDIYLRSGSLPGRDEENWLAAEIELKRDIEAAHAVTAPKPVIPPVIQPQVKMQAPPPLIKPVPPVVVKPAASATACGCTPPPAPKAKPAPRVRKAKARR